MFLSLRFLFFFYTFYTHFIIPGSLGFSSQLRGAAGGGAVGRVLFQFVKRRTVSVWCCPARHGPELVWEGSGGGSEGPGEGSVLRVPAVLPPERNGPDRAAPHHLPPPSAPGRTPRAEHPAQTGELRKNTLYNFTDCPTASFDPLEPGRALPGTQFLSRALGMLAEQGDILQGIMGNVVFAWPQLLVSFKPSLKHCSNKNEPLFHQGHVFVWVKAIVRGLCSNSKPLFKCKATVSASVGTFV